MKIKPVILVLVSLVVLLFSCSKSDETNSLNDFSGFYKIQSISSSLPIDLNNDGAKTTDYLQEIKSIYTTYNGETINFGYDNELSHNFAEARPTKYQMNNTKFLDIRFPIQRIDSVNQGNGNFEKTNMEYTRINTSFIYKITKQNIEIESDSFNEFEFYNMNNFVITRLNKDEFEIKFDFHIYDFAENEWVETNLNAKYVKTTDE